MKYLFFFKGQPLLLCCVCCKIAIQDFLRGLHKKNKKNFMFYRRNITRRYFTESWKKLTGLCHTHWRLYWRNITRRYFHIELQTNYRIVPQSPTVYRRRYRHQIPTESPTNSRTSRSARMSDMCPSAQIPTAVPASNTDEFTHIPKRTHVWHVSICTNTDGVSDGSKSLAGFSNFFWYAFQLIFDGITDGI
jgi:hypothetical protein